MVAACAETASVFQVAPGTLVASIGRLLRCGWMCRAPILRLARGAGDLDSAILAPIGVLALRNARNVTAIDGTTRRPTRGGSQASDLARSALLLAPLWGPEGRSDNVIVLARTGARSHHTAHRQHSYRLGWCRRSDRVTIPFVDDTCDPVGYA